MAIEKHRHSQLADRINNQSRQPSNETTSAAMSCLNYSTLTNSVGCISHTLTTVLFRVVVLLVLCLCQSGLGHGYSPKRTRLDNTLSDQVKGTSAKGEPSIAVQMDYANHQGSDELYQWGSWSELSPCSRTCGLGLRYRKRECNKITQNSSVIVSFTTCRGEDTEYRLCDHVDCDTEEPDVRINACANHDNKKYKGRYYHWKPLDDISTTGVSLCELVCQADNYPFHIVRKFPNSLPDGTTCRTNQTQGICINTQCIPIGCDKTLHSTKTNDVCGICDGNNKTCDVIQGEIRKNISHGYTNVLTIPPLAKNIRVSDLGEALAVFAIRNDYGIYFVNGKLSSTYPTVYNDVGRTKFLYYHPMYETNGVEKLEATGPTNETLYVMMLSPEQMTEVFLSYQYSIPKPKKRRKLPTTIAPPAFIPPTEAPTRAHGYHLYKKQTPSQQRHDYTQTKKFAYDRSKSPTNDSTQISAHRFNSSNSVELGSSSYADDRYSERVHHMSRDYDDNNPYHWVTNNAAHCSATCNNGIQRAHTRCARRADGQEVDDAYCDARRRPNPVAVQCQGKPCDPRWETGNWEKCSTSCGDGQQTRSVHCWRLMAVGFDSSVHVEMCRSLAKPPNTRRCTATDCGPVWESSEWSKCSNKCGHGIQNRAVRCSSTIESCDLINKPISFRQCSSGTCFNKWVVSKWSVCSGSCGAGLQYRRVSCLDPSGSYLDDDHCDQNRKPLSVEACGDRSSCPPIWVAQTWRSCSVDCGDGLISRDVVCGEVTGGQFKVTDEQKCRHLYKPATRSRCRKDPCSAQWYRSEWTECSQTCGTDGYHTRRVTCYADQLPSTSCDMRTKPANREACNVTPCNRNTVDKRAKQHESVKYPCVDKDGINCQDVVNRQGCTVHRYRNLCCQSCKNHRISSNNTTYRSPRSVRDTPDNAAPWWANSVTRTNSNSERRRTVSFA